MQVQQLKYTLRNLNLQISDLLHMFGNRDADILTQSEWEYLNRELALHNNMQGGYSLYEDLSFDIENKSITIGNIPFNIGPVLYPRFINVEKIAIVVGTVGAGLEGLYKQHIEKGEILIGYSLDALGTLITDRILQNVKENLKKEMLKKGFSITACYSPGYCDWPLSEQKKIFSLLPENFCDITLSDSCLMFPLKSVSGLIGVGYDVKEDFLQCRICNMTNCYMRKEEYFTQTVNE